jgi:hypothetical protein
MKQVASTKLIESFPCIIGGPNIMAHHPRFMTPGIFAGVFPQMTRFVLTQLFR